MIQIKGQSAFAPLRTVMIPQNGRSTSLLSRAGRRPLERTAGRYFGILDGPVRADSLGLFKGKCILRDVQLEPWPRARPRQKELSA